MSKQEVRLNFNKGFNGELAAKNGSVAVGGKKGQLSPYDMLLGALGSCYYATFLDVIEKMRISLDSANIHVTGEKREENPAFLKWVNLDITIHNPSSEKGLERAADLAGKYCSIHQTIAKVAKMSHTISIVY